MPKGKKNKNNHSVTINTEALFALLDSDEFALARAIFVGKKLDINGEEQSQAVINALFFYLLERQLPLLEKLTPLVPHHIAALFDGEENDALNAVDEPLKSNRNATLEPYYLTIKEKIKAIVSILKELHDCLNSINECLLLIGSLPNHEKRRLNELNFYQRFMGELKDRLEGYNGEKLSYYYFNNVIVALWSALQVKDPNTKEMTSITKFLAPYTFNLLYERVIRIFSEKTSSQAKRFIELLRQFNLIEIPKEDFDFVETQFNDLQKQIQSIKKEYNQSKDEIILQQKKEYEENFDKILADLEKIDTSPNSIKILSAWVKKAFSIQLQLKTLATQLTDDENIDKVDKLAKVILQTQNDLVPELSKLNASLKNSPGKGLVEWLTEQTEEKRLLPLLKKFYTVCFQLTGILQQARTQLEDFYTLEKNRIKAKKLAGELNTKMCIWQAAQTQTDTTLKVLEETLDSIKKSALNNLNSWELLASIAALSGEKIVRSSRKKTRKPKLKKIQQANLTDEKIIVGNFGPLQETIGYLNSLFPEENIYLINYAALSVLMSAMGITDTFFDCPHVDFVICVKDGASQEKLIAELAKNQFSKKANLPTVQLVRMERKITITIVTGNGLASQRWPQARLSVLDIAIDIKNGTIEHRGEYTLAHLADKSLYLSKNFTQENFKSQLKKEPWAFLYLLWLLMEGFKWDTNLGANWLDALSLQPEEVNEESRKEARTILTKLVLNKNYQEQLINSQIKILPQLLYTLFQLSGKPAFVDEQLLQTLTNQDFKNESSEPDTSLISETQNAPVATETPEAPPLKRILQKKPPVPLEEKFVPHFFQPKDNVEISKSEMRIVGKTLTSGDMEKIVNYLNRNPSVHTLDLSHCSIAPEHLKKISKLQYIHTLNLKGVIITNEVMSSLGKNPSITSLDLSSANISDRGVQLLLENNKEFLSLKLGSNQLSNAIIQNLADCNKLEILDLHNNQVTDPSPLAKITTLKELDLCRNQVSPQKAQSLGNFPMLQKLDLSSNKLGEGEGEGKKESIKALLEILFSHPTLKELKLGWNNFNDKKLICNNFTKKNETLDSLDLSGNQIGDKGAAWILENILNLSSLDLGNNHIKNIPASAFKEGSRLSILVLKRNKITTINSELNNPELKTLDLSNNPITDPQALTKLGSEKSNLKFLNLACTSISLLPGLILLLNHSSIETLDFSKNKMGSPDRNAGYEQDILGFLQSITKSKLIYLDLSDNKIKDGLFKQILDVCLKELKNPLKLNLRNNHINNEGIQYFKEAADGIVTHPGLDVDLSNNKFSLDGTLYLASLLQSIDNEKQWLSIQFNPGEKYLAILKDPVRRTNMLRGRDIPSPVPSLVSLCIFALEKHMIKNKPGESATLPDELGSLPEELIKKLGEVNF